MPGLSFNSLRKIICKPVRPVASAVIPRMKFLILCLSDAFDNFTLSVVDAMIVSGLNFSCEDVYFWFVDCFLLIDRFPE